MSDSGAIPIITAKIGDRQRRLSTAKQWRIAIVNRDLKRETPIQYELGLRQEEMLAGACPELMPLFDEVLGPVAVAPPPPPSPPPPTPPVEPEVAADEADDLEPEPEEPEPEADYVYRQPNDPAPARQPDSGFWTPKALGLAAVAGIGLLLLMSGQDDRAVTAPDPAIEQAAAAAAAPAEVRGSRFFTRRSVLVYASPLESAPTLRVLGRGDEVLGVFDSTASWVRLTERSGGFVPSNALQDNPPPPLDGTTADDYFALESAPILSAPTYGSPEVGSLATGSKISVFGTVNDEFAEYALDDGSIGYVRWDVFGGVGGKGRRGWLEISNRCDVFKNLAISLVIDGERVNGDVFWTFPPGKTDSISFDGETRIEVDSAELYYRDLGENFHLEPETQVVGHGLDQVVVNGQRKDMKRLVPVATEEGAYRVTFC